MRKVRHHCFWYFSYPHGHLRELAASWIPYGYEVARSLTTKGRFAMLGRKNCTQEELDHAKPAVDQQLAAYKKLVKAVDSATSDSKVTSASLMNNDGVLPGNNVVKLIPDQSVGCGRSCTQARGRQVTTRSIHPRSPWA